MSAAGGLVNFLERKRVTTQGDAHTHTTAGSAPGKYFIGEDDLQEFYELYYDYVEVHRNKIWLIEAPTPLGICRVDLDLLYEAGTTTNLHTRDQVTTFVREYVDTLKRYLTFADDVKVYVMEKKKPVIKRDGAAGGIHIMIPKLKTNKYIELAVRESMLTRMGDIFGDLPLKEKEWSKVYDKTVASRSTGWTMYGAAKPGGLPYITTMTVTVGPSTFAVDESPVAFTIDLLKDLCIRELDDSKETPMTADATRLYGNLPDTTDQVRISGGRAVAPSRGRPAERRLPGSRDSSPNPAMVLRPLSAEEMQHVRDHVQNLAPHRAFTYIEWVEVGQCLKNIHPDLYDEFEEFSRQDTAKFNLRECMSKWNSFSFRNDGQRLMMGSLMYWSRQDNPDMYFEIEKSNILRKIDASHGGAEYDVASVVYSKYRDQYKCVNFGKNVWFKFMGHVWVELDRGIQLQQELSTEIWKMYKQRAGFYNQKLTDGSVTQCNAKEPKDCASNGCEYCSVLIMEDDLAKIAKQLKKTAFKENVMKECRELFLDETFIKKVDENRHLLACRNGVFDMEKCEFRDGKPEDYLSFSTNLDYDPQLSHRDYREWLEIQDFMTKVLPDPEVREYVERHFSRSLNGIGNQKLHILTGTGSNGKSMLINLMETAMGDYACKVPISLLTQGRNKASAASPETIRLKGRRYVSMQEPDETVPLNTGLMKELTSSEKIIARDLYSGAKSMIEFELQCKFHLACNDKPKVNSNDGGTWRRLVVINFLSKFVPNPDGVNQYKLDTSIERKVKSEEWGKCFLAYLIYLFKKYHGSELQPPEKVLEYTKEYREENNAITKFINECTRESGADEDAVGIRKPTLTDTFKTWWETNRGTRDWKVQEMFKEIEARYGKYPYGGWKSFQIRTDID